MIRKFKTLGVAMFAVLALTAVGASAAHAETGKFTAGSYPATFTTESAKGNDTFITEAGTVECQSHFEGTLAEASTTVTVKATYTNCRAFGFLSATVNMTGCDYLFHIESAAPSDSYTGSSDLVCPAGVSVDIVASTCTATIPGQTGIKPIDFTNNT